jgi:hypothetical protein
MDVRVGTLVNVMFAVTFAFAFLALIRCRVMVRSTAALTTTNPRTEHHIIRALIAVTVTRRID